MRTQKQRIDELERRVMRLERELKISRDAERAPSQQTQIRREVERPQEEIHKAKEVPIKPQINKIPPSTPKTETQRDFEPKKYALKEAIVGKYIVGALASLLVFIGAISLVILFWDAVTPEMKLALLVTVSLVITALGYIRTLKERNHVNSIILGTGAGLIFISILSSYIYFEYIGSNTAFFLSGLWAMLFILSYKYTKTYFTTVIAYIGSFLATILGLKLATDLLKLNVVLIFVASIALALIISGFKWLSKKETFINLSLSTLSFLTVLFWIWGKTEFTTIQINKTVYMIFLSIIIYVLRTLAETVMDNFTEESDYYKIASLISNGVVGVVVGLILVSSLGNTGRIVFVLLNLSQILFNEWRLRENRKFLTIMNTIFIELVVFQGRLTVSTGIFITVLLIAFLLAIEYRSKRRDYEELRIGLIVFSMYQLLERINMKQVNLALYLLAVLTLIGVVGAMLFEKYRQKDKTHIILIKSIAYVLFIQATVLFLMEGITRINTARILDSPINELVTIYAVVTIEVVVSLKAGYFKDWFDSEFKWFRKNSDVREDFSYILFFIVTTLMYFFSLLVIALKPPAIETTIILLSSIAVMVVQSMELFKLRERSEYIGVLEGIKYLLYSWVVMVGLLDFRAFSLSTSIVGLAVALISISIGFSKKMRGLRLYGLVVTLLMVFKIITVDIAGANSITRVVSLVIGGLICFVISIIYNRIDKSMED